MSTSYQDFNRNLINDLRANGGKATSGPFMGRDLVILTTKGAKTAEVRENPVVYSRDADNYVIVASKGGSPTNPAWYYNLRNHPNVVFGGLPLRAEIVEDEAERQRLWDLADRVYPQYADFREQAGKAGRIIPIIQLVPR